MKHKKIPLILLAAAMLAAPATAQQGSAPVLRSESSDQLRQATPDIGIRRAPTASQAPARSLAGNEVSPPAPGSRPEELDGFYVIARDGADVGCDRSSTCGRTSASYMARAS